MENPLEMPTPPAEQPEPKIPRLGDLTGRTLGGDFQLVRRIGQGGMGQVYLARQISLNRQVAVKILRTDLASNFTALQRFQQEAKAVARITHANIVQVYSIGESEDSLHYMVLEYVEGRNLRDYINRKGPPDLPVCISIMRQVAAALQRAGELGFVHRDIKPENILLTRKGEVKVADFGLSRCFTDDQPLNITQSGVTMGTPLYMSPEQVQGHAVDPRSDIYSFGVTCYHMFAGEPPFKGQTPFEVALQHVQNEPPPLLEIRPDLPAEVGVIVHKMMAKKPEDRYQTPREVLRDLTRLKEGLPPSGVQAVLIQSGASPVSATRTNHAVSLSSTGTHELVAPASRWRRWALFIGLIVFAAAAGAFVHWRTTASAVNKPHETAGVRAANDSAPNPVVAQQKDLLKRLNEKKIVSDLEVTNALLELAMLYINERSPEELQERRIDEDAAKKRFKKALDLFDRGNLNNMPAVVEAQKIAPLPGMQYFTIVSALGKGIVLSQQDNFKESNAELKKVLGQVLPPKAKAIIQADKFLWRYDRWKRLVADSLERNAKNQGVERLDDQLNRYRWYSSKMP